jgi:chemotaxis protein MotB
MRSSVVNMIRTGRGKVAALAIGLAALASGLGGCNSGNQALGEANRALQDRNTALTQENESLKNLVGQLNGSLTAKERLISEQNSLLNDLRAGNSDLSNKFADLDRRMQGNPFGQINVSALDSATDQALKDLANRHSDLLEYDSSRGLLRFKSDLTFGSGSDQLSSSAKSTLAQLAGILNQSAAGYDCRVVGHTDAQRLSAATRQRHGTNIRLSCDRAISVRNELVASGVMAARFEVGGRGEFDPLVPNTGNGNTPQNRRVEIFLVPARTKIDVTPADDFGGGSAAPARPASSGDDIMK